MLWHTSWPTVLSVVQGEFLLDCKTYNFFKQENTVASAESKNKT